MKLYKFTPNSKIADQISIGIFRFYELTKYIHIEDNMGRSDPAECSVTFLEHECHEFPEKIPIASLGGIKFSCTSIKPSDEYIRQYFVFCMSTQINMAAIGDSKYAVELEDDVFEVFTMLLRSLESESESGELRIFTHGNVEYFNIHNHPKPLNGEKWREVYLKHSDYEYQQEYRAAIFSPSHFFKHLHEEPMVLECEILDGEGNPVDFNLKLSINSGIDEEGWRFIELDISEFSNNICKEPSKIIDCANVKGTAQNSSKRDTVTGAPS